MKAWHFLSDDGCLSCGGSKVEVGKTYTAVGPLELCKNGMHASLRALDALKYAPGSIVCRVEMSGEMIHGDDKLCARERKVLAMADATRELHLFACDVAEDALKKLEQPDPRIVEVVRVKRLWVDGGATGRELAAALDAARAAAWDVAWAAVRAAAWAAALDAAWNAAWAAALDAAWAAAWDAAWDKYNTWLEERLEKLLAKKGGAS